MPLREADATGALFLPVATVCLRLNPILAMGAHEPMFVAASTRENATFLEETLI